MDKNPLQPQSGQTSLPEPIAQGDQLPPAMPATPAPEHTAQQTQSAQAVPSPTDSLSVNPPTPPAPAPTAIPGAVQVEGDKLGQEWLALVDSLVRQNIQDPRKLSKEFEKAKAAYISKRYGKELKQSDSEK